MIKLNDQEFVAHCHEQVRYGVPMLTVEEQKRLVEIASGKVLEKRKRCWNCDGEGIVSGWTYGWRVGEQCGECQGRGYVK